MDNKIGTAKSTASVLSAELRILIGKFCRKFKKESHMGDFSWSQISVLLRLEREGPGTVTALAKAEGVRPQSLGATISSLEAEGLITSSPDPEDGRQTILDITDQCRENIRSGRAAKEDWLYRAVNTALTDKEQEKLLESLDILKRVVNVK
ncbi:transcriptional regulator, MarR family [Denitrovibrio acetiphilus DSM 12809]|uniref:Transcriptional regulator, MarR family n=1 Tax=Denitrovibrio acetiphilus (strain DSM 12809 / NBRC 114555 / N2460) TaxID=522772 RepID=D4H269_DENA2|nr:MarR family transcriptional regulator [Denitrovibrio acetiphilus]ADD68860.1 transcriptional regulator, MarR family [Denitrovibrio acetiphilus DSM 12809]